MTLVTNHSFYKASPHRSLHHQLTLPFTPLTLFSSHSEHQGMLFFVCYCSFDLHSPHPASMSQLSARFHRLNTRRSINKPKPSPPPCLLQSKPHPSSFSRDTRRYVPLMTSFNRQMNPLPSILTRQGLGMLFDQFRLHDPLQL